MTQDFPDYRFNPHEAFPEVPARLQTTGRAWCRGSDLTLTLAYLLAGKRFEGTLASIPLKTLYDEIEHSCGVLGITIERLATWADSILLPPATTLSQSEMDAIPMKLPKTGYVPHPFQRTEAAWNIARRGTVANLGMGVGKTLTAVLAAIGAVRLGKCSDEHCLVSCPLNARGTWEEFGEELKAVFKNVTIASVDSLHHFSSMDRSAGGFLIFDEAHRLKHEEADRTAEAHELRLAFENCIVLTGSFLHTGVDCVVSLQDLACPGLSRFMDNMAFGEVFNCVHTIKLGKQRRRKLGKPSFDKSPELVGYLARGVRSLSYESPSVHPYVTVPNQEQVSVDTWKQPAWFETLHADHLKTYVGAADPEEAFCYFYPPEGTQVKALAMTAMAMQKENRERLIERAAAEPENKELQDELAEPAGLPALTSVFDATRREGIYDRCFKRANNSYEFCYAPGTDWHNPAPGPKLWWLADWLKNNPAEPIVVGAYGVPTLEMVEKLLKSQDIAYRLIRGGVDAKDRKVFIKEFNEDKFRVMLIQQIAGSESVNLSHAANSCLLDSDYGPNNYDQFRRRTARQGQKRPCTHYDIIFNAWQQDIHGRLISGVEFDTDTREKLEQLTRTFIRTGRE